MGDERSRFDEHALEIAAFRHRVIAEAVEADEGEVTAAIQTVAPSWPLPDRRGDRGCGPRPGAVQHPEAAAAVRAPEAGAAGELSRLAYESVRERMAAAAGKDSSFRPERVAVIQTFGDRLNPHPHQHARVSREGWTASGEWIPLPYVDPKAAEGWFRHKRLRLLRRKQRLSQERLEKEDPLLGAAGLGGGCEVGVAIGVNT
jgi:hypothetical protein